MNTSLACRMTCGFREGCSGGRLANYFDIVEFTVSRKRRPVSATAASSSSPASSKAEKASADSTSAHLYEK